MVRWQLDPPAGAPDLGDLPEQPNAEALDAVFEAEPFARTIGAELVGWGPGWARIEWTPTDDHRNFAGTVHGGALFTLGDSAFAVSCNSWGRAAVALSVDVHFLAAVRPGERLVATGVERSRTRRTGSYAIDVHTGDRQVASLHAMAYRTGQWHLGEDAWPESWRSLA